jgi:maltooligosyltrehalose trehalohydrolase
MMDFLCPGAEWTPTDRCRFRVWAPRARAVELRLLEPERQVAMQPLARGYHEAVVDGIVPGQRYLYRLADGPERPDPASRWQPDGVHAPSAVDDPTFAWHDDRWCGLALEELVLYELHAGTFTPEGTFDAAIGQLDRLVELGVTALSLMPVAQFPGTRNWGYDGAYPFAVQASYGGTKGLKRLVDGAHRRGLAVILDVVYNHFGPEGNYLRDFAPSFFSDQHKTPWGEAINFDGPGSDEVRHYFLCNARRWQEEFHLDGLRLDAVHAIKDLSAWPFLAELAEGCHQQARRLKRPFHLIAESDLNDARLIRPTELGGYGLDAQWADDFHHAVHTLLTGERHGYYADFGTMADLVRAWREGYAYAGRYSRVRGRRHGNSPAGLPPERFVVSVQNHDQVGNRAHGDRLAALVDFESLKLAAGLMLLSPYLPLLFMGEEYGETAPFLYITSHGDPALVEAVRQGRREEFAWQGQAPDPQDERTFVRSGLDLARGNPALAALYRELIRLRRLVRPLYARPVADELHADERRMVLLVRRPGLVLLFHLGAEPVPCVLPWPAGTWQLLLASADERWQGPGSGLPGRIEASGEVAVALTPRSFAVYEEKDEG